jgi:hypothetical protein
MKLSPLSLLLLSLLSPLATSAAEQRDTRQNETPICRIGGRMNRRFILPGVTLFSGGSGQRRQQRQQQLATSAAEQRDTRQNETPIHAPANPAAIAKIPANFNPRLSASSRAISGSLPIRETLSDASSDSGGELLADRQRSRYCPAAGRQSGIKT